MVCWQAPFGLSEDVDLVLGEDVASNDYKAIYRNWEDSLASKLYQLHRMPEDRIAATLQLYVEKKQDPEVLSPCLTIVSRLTLTLMLIDPSNPSRQ